MRDGTARYEDKDWVDLAAGCMSSASEAMQAGSSARIAKKPLDYR